MRGGTENFATKPVNSSACEFHSLVRIGKTPVLRGTCLRIVGFIHSFSTVSVETGFGVKLDSARTDSRAILQTKHELEPRPDFVDGTNLDVHETLRQPEFTYDVIGKICLHA